MIDQNKREMFRVLKNEFKRRKSNGETKKYKKRPPNNNPGTVHTPAIPTQIQAVDQMPQIDQMPHICSYWS